MCLLNEQIIYVPLAFTSDAGLMNEMSAASCRLDVFFDDKSLQIQLVLVWHVIRFQNFEFLQFPKERVPANLKSVIAEILRHRSHIYQVV